jgi:hypothetical protein
VPKIQNNRYISITYVFKSVNPWIMVYTFAFVLYLCASKRPAFVNSSCKGLLHRPLSAEAATSALSLIKKSAANERGHVLATTLEADALAL